MLNATLRNRLAFASLLSLFAFLPQTASAAPCTVAGPVAANAKTTVVYDPVTANMKACIGGNWLDMSGGGGGGNLDGLTDVTIASPSTNQALVYNGSAWVNASLSLTESDPKVGALTANQWCAANAGGTAIVCNQAAPSGGGSSSGTAGYVQTSGGSGAFASSSTTAGQQLFWDGTNHRLGIGVNTPTTQLTIGTTGTITVQNGGSAATPAYAVTTGGLGVNGMFVPAANSVAFVTSATERARIDSNGDLGVGTTNPIARLHISGTGTNDSAILLADSDAGADLKFLRIYNDSGKTYVDTPNDAFSGVTSQLMTFDHSNGRIGIGTTSPQAKLDIGGTTPTLKLSNGGTAGIQLLDWTDNNQYFDFKGDLRFRDGIDGAGNNSPLTLTSTGNVGIGLTNPGHKLQVVGGSTGAAILGTGNDSAQYAGIFYAQNGLGGAYLAHNQYMVNGTSSNAGTTGIYGYVSGASSIGVQGYATQATSHAFLAQNTSSSYYCYIGYANTYALICSGPNNIVSDQRLKKDITSLDRKEGLDAIMALRPVSYLWKDDRKNQSGKRQLGFVAQEVEKVLPDVVNTFEPTTDAEKASAAEGEGKLRSVQYEGLIAPLVQAVQELKAENDALRARLEKLEAAQ